MTIADFVNGPNHAWSRHTEADIKTELSAEKWLAVKVIVPVGFLGGYGLLWAWH